MTTDQVDGREWQRHLTKTIANEIRRYRELRGWTAQRLAAECAAHGMEIARSTLAGIETGRRENITIAELWIISRALDVSPIALQLPLGPMVDSLSGEDRSGRVDITPKETVSITDALQWLDGHLGSQSKQFVADMRRHQELVTECLRYRNRVSSLLVLADEHPNERDKYSREIAFNEDEAQRAEGALATHRKEMRARNEVPPPLLRILAALIEPREGDKE